MGRVRIELHHSSVNGRTQNMPIFIHRLCMKKMSINCTPFFICSMVYVKMRPVGSGWKGQLYFR